MNDRELAIQAIRRGAPIGEVVRCSCFTSPPKRKGCDGVCEDTVAAVIKAFEHVRKEPILTAEEKDILTAVERRYASDHNLQTVFGMVRRALRVSGPKHGPAPEYRELLDASDVRDL